MEAVAKQPICDHFLRIHPGIGQIRAEGAAGMGGEGIRLALLRPFNGMTLETFVADGRVDHPKLLELASDQLFDNGKIMCLGRQVLGYATALAQLSKYDVIVIFNVNLYEIWFAILIKQGRQAPQGNLYLPGLWIGRARQRTAAQMLVIDKKCY
jgi:hypothetical protein